MNLTIILFASFIFTLLKIVETYVFRDWEFLKWIAVLIVVDTMLGMVKAWFDYSFSSAGFSKFFKKLFLYGSVLVVTNVLTCFTINGQHPGVLDWFSYFALVAMIIRECISIFEKVAALDPGLLPTWILPRLRALDFEIGDRTFDKKITDDAPNKNSGNGVQPPQ